MPPCAAIECARRGESWMQTFRTLYPSSPSDAAADAPARPVPTTIIVYFRLFAGLTSFISNLCRSHFSAIGPGGILASSFTASTLSASTLRTAVTIPLLCVRKGEKHPQSYDDETAGDDDGD